MTHQSSGQTPDYERFKKALINTMELMLPDDVTVDVRRYPKDNGYQPEGISFKRLGPLPQDQLICSPVFYVDDFYRSCGHTAADIRELAVQLVDYYQKSQDFAPRFFQAEIDFFEDFGTARNYLVYRLVNTQANREKLQELPHRPFLDLSIIFMLLPPCGEGPQYTCTVTNALMEAWHVDVEALFEAACENTPRLLPFHLQSLREALQNLGRAAASDFEEALPMQELIPPSSDEDAPMYVLSNEYARHGASVILYPDVLRTCADFIDSDLYILPSSIHEVIIIDPKRSAPIRDLRTMVCSVNADVVGAEEILSDQVYYYSRSDDSLSFADICDSATED